MAGGVAKAEPLFSAIEEEVDELLVEDDVVVDIVEEDEQLLEDDAVVDIVEEDEGEQSREDAPQKPYRLPTRCKFAGGQFRRPALPCGCAHSCRDSTVGMEQCSRGTRVCCVSSPSFSFYSHGTARGVKRQR